MCIRDSHGDYAKISQNGGFIIYGRSDTTLNPGGVRLGTAEIYSQVEKFDEIKDSIVVGQSWDNDIRIVLFIVLNQNYKLNEDLLLKIKKISIAIAGTHGKTTTCSMLGCILSESNLDPTLVIGGIVNKFQSNTISGNGDIIVVEADEFDRSFHLFQLPIQEFLF